jgi:hypothetical protein
MHAAVAALDWPDQGVVPCGPHTPLLHPASPPPRSCASAPHLPHPGPWACAWCARRDAGSEGELRLGVVGKVGVGAMHQGQGTMGQSSGAAQADWGGSVGAGWPHARRAVSPHLPAGAACDHPNRPPTPTMTCLHPPCSHARMHSLVPSPRARTRTRPLSPRCACSLSLSLSRTHTHTCARARRPCTRATRPAWTARSGRACCHPDRAGHAGQRQGAGGAWCACRATPTTGARARRAPVGF